MLDFVYQDASLLVVNKPSGLLSVPGRGEHKQDSLVTRVQQHYPEALVVHRLDMATSGLMLMARSKPVQSEMGRLFARQQIGKLYIAWVEGKCAARQGIVDLPLICDWPNRPRQKVCFEHGKPSLTYYRVLAYDDGGNCSRIALSPYTGRSHQLRVHMQALGHPILGDEFYAGPTAQSKSARLLLHASELAFQHPVTGAWVHLESRPEF